MSILFLLIPLGLMLLGLGVAAFFWAVGAGQFDDLDSPGVSVLLDDDAAPVGRPQESSSNKDAR